MIALLTAGVLSVIWIVFVVSVIRRDIVKPQRRAAAEFDLRTYLRDQRRREFAEWDDEFGRLGGWGVPSIAVVDGRYVVRYPGPGTVAPGHSETSNQSQDELAPETEFEVIRDSAGRAVRRIPVTGDTWIHERYEWAPHE